MATAEQGGATTNTTENPTNPYEGGAGGKLRKKPVRRQTTPYDRPNNNSKVGWLKNLVVDQASKLLSYGTNRLFGSVVQKNLLPPPVVNQDAGEVIPESAPNEELIVANSSHPIDNSNSNGISELEKLLKRNTFTRPEALHLIELLHSRAVEVVASADDSKKMETLSVFGRYDVNRNEGVRSHGATTSTPIFTSRVHEEDIGSPAELAKAYMGSRPSKVSPSMLGVNRQVGREDTRLLNNIPFIANSPMLPLSRKNSSIGAVENYFVTPRSRGRSALYNMARTPYSRVHPASSLKGGGNNNNDYRSSMPSTPIAITEHGEKTESKSTNLKRRSSYLDDEVGSGSGSVGPIRRIRQKQNLLIPRMPQSARGVGIGSSQQKLPLDEANNDRNKNGSVASTSYAFVPARSREMASQILQHVNNMSPKEKSPGSKIAAVMDKSPFKSTPGIVLHEQARRSMESVGTSELTPNGKDYGNMEDKSNTNVPDSRESTQNQEKVGETGGKESVAPLNLWSSAKKNDESVMPLKVGMSDFLARDNASQHLHKNIASRMNGQEGGDVQYNGIAPVSLSKEKGLIEENNLSTAEDLKSLKTTIQPEVKSTSDFVSSKTSEFSASGPEKTGEGSNGIALRALEETSKASQSAVVPSPATVFDKPKDNQPSLFAPSSNVGDKFLPSTSESSSKNPELNLNGPSNFSNISAPNGFQSKSREFEKADMDLQKAADKTGKSDTALPASNGQFGSGTSTTSSGKSTLEPATTTLLVSAPSATEISKVTDSSQPVSSTSFPPFTTNSGNAFGSSFSCTPPFSSNSVTPVSESISTFTKLESSSTATSAANISSSFSNGASGVFNFVGSSSTSPAPMNPFTSSSCTPSNGVGTIFGSTFNPSNPSTGFVFNSSSTPATTNTAQPPVFNSPPSGSPIFQFGATSAPAITTPSIFCNTNSIVEASPGKNNDQMNAEDSMAEDPRQSSMPIFGQPAVSHSLPGFTFGQAPPFQANPFQFGGQTSQATPNPFQASSSQDYNTGPSGFSLGSGGNDKSTRRTVKVNRNKFKKK